jgi:CheY-specific phosphatase CheX
MRINKYVLLVDRPRGSLSVLVDDMKRLEFRVALVPGRDEALSFMRRFRKLGLVAINVEQAADASDLAREVREVHANLPIVLLEKNGCVIRTTSREWRVDGPLGANQLAAQVAQALREHSYPEHVRGALAFAVEEAMAGFHNHVVAGQAYLRATNGAVAEVTALLPFSGDSVSGYLAVGASKKTATLFHRNLFPRRSGIEDEDLADLLGEVCNRAIGRLHEHLEKRGLPFNFGVSLHLTGKPQMRTAPSHPALVTEFEGPVGSLLVELFVGSLIPDSIVSDPVDGLANAGEFVLL